MFMCDPKGRKGGQDWPGASQNSGQQRCWMIASLQCASMHKTMVVSNCRPAIQTSLVVVAVWSAMEQGGG